MPLPYYLLQTGTTWDLPEIKPTIPRKAVPKTQLTSVTENGNIHEKPQEKPQVYYAKQMIAA